MKQVAAIAGMTAIMAGGAPMSELPQAFARTFRPKKVLRGKRVKPEGTKLSLVVPNGWQSSWVKRGGQEAYVIAPSGGGKNGAIFATAQQMSKSDRAKGIGPLLRAAAQQVTGSGQGKVVFGPRTFTVGGRPGGQMIVQLSSNGRAVEVNAAAVIIDGWAIAFVGLYAQAQADLFRAAVDTVVSSLRGRMPKPKIDKKLVGCWEYYYSPRGGGGSSQTKFYFYANGSYSYRHYTSVGGSLRRSHEQGTWSVSGGQITTVPSNGASSSVYRVRWKGRMLYLNGTRYLPCS